MSIPSVAVADFGKRVFERFDNKNVLLIGAGAMAAETLEHLCAEGARQISVINRSISRARELARQWHGEAYPWSQLHEQIAKADLIVSTTSAPEAIMTADDFLALEQMRPQKPLLVLDLAVPRDFDPAIGERPSVYLYSVDDLQAACDANRHRRQQDLPKALQIVENEALQFMSHLNHRAASPVVQCLRQNWQGVKSSEFDRLARKLPELDDKSLQEVSRSFDRLVNKLLHTPLESLRQASQRESPDRLLESIAKLFRLDL